MKLTDPRFTDADKAREYLEAIQWPNGPVCPHCGNVDAARITKLAGKSTRPGVHKCKECGKPFTVTVGTVFERSHIKLNLWLAASAMMASSKKGVSAHQLHRQLGVTYKTAWFMAHRLREAMKADVKSAGPLGGKGKIVEADETYFGKTDIQPKTRTDGTPFKKGGRRGPTGKRAVVALVERGGNVRSFHVETATRDTVQDILFRNVDRKSALHTDESRLYTIPGAEFDAHRTVNHSGEEYVRYEGDLVVHSNTVENVFSVFKRGMIGIYQHCGEAHLHRYLAEFDFRYNRRAKIGFTDAIRTDELLAAIRGKRLTYRRIGEAGVSQSAN